MSENNLISNLQSSISDEFNCLKESFTIEKGKNIEHGDPLNYHVALLLCTFFGFLGVDRFYLGKIGAGILKLILLIFSPYLILTSGWDTGEVGGLFGFFGSVMLLIWWLNDWFKLLYNKTKDGHGRPLAGSDRKESIVLVLMAFSGINHYFYLRYTWLGVAKILIVVLFLGLDGVGSSLFLSVFMIWWIIDFYLILSGRFVRDAKGILINNVGEKYQIVALIMSALGGLFGLDRFYLGHRTLGLLKLFTFGGMFLWYFLDMALILLNIIKDNNGKSLIQG